MTSGGGGGVFPRFSITLYTYMSYMRWPKFGPSYVQGVAQTPKHTFSLIRVSRTRLSDVVRQPVMRG